MLGVWPGLLYVHFVKITNEISQMLIKSELKSFTFYKNRSISRGGSNPVGYHCFLTWPNRGRKPNTPKKIVNFILVFLTVEKLGFLPYLHEITAALSETSTNKSPINVVILRKYQLLAREIINIVLFSPIRNVGEFCWNSQNFLPANYHYCLWFAKLIHTIFFFLQTNRDEVTK